MTETATLAGGCFWCLEAVYQDLEGVLSVEPGYTGGEREKPTYEEVCTGTTGHAEAARLTFDPDVVSYRGLLEVFFSIHDPTTPNRQGSDVGPQYRSAIFYHSEAQREAAGQILRELAGAFPAPIVTELLPAPAFYPAEDYHRDYFRTHPRQPYCSYVIAPKLAKFRQKFAGLRRAAGE